MDRAEVTTRIQAYWKPYHRCLTAELQRLRRHHARVLLWEAHTIRSEVPQLFRGRLPDLNLGTNDGASCDHALADRLYEIAKRAPSYSAVLNGRIKGGYITRSYGAPSTGVHAVQLELAQLTYMRETPPFTFIPERANKIRPTLKALLTEALVWARN